MSLAGWLVHFFKISYFCLTMLLLRLGIICYGDNVKQKVREFLLQKQCDALSFRMFRKFRTWARKWTQPPTPVHCPTGFHYFLHWREVFIWLTGTTIWQSILRLADPAPSPVFVLSTPWKNPHHIDLTLCLVLLICTFYLVLPVLTQAEKAEH